MPGKRTTALLFPLLLSACQSIGTQYVFPDETQDSATLTGGEFLINQFGEDGCYSGRTHVTGNTRLHADKEVVIAVEHNAMSHGWRGDPLFCRVIFSFTPIRNGQYTLVFDDSRKVPGKNLFGTAITYPICTVAVMKQNEDGSSSPVDITGLQLSQRKLACIKVVPIVSSPDKQRSQAVSSPLAPTGTPTPLKF